MLKHLKEFASVWDRTQETKRDVSVHLVNFELVVFYSLLELNCGYMNTARDM
jgi:hypothetical protein